MDAKNLIIPAGLMYYSYSSNAALEKMLQQQKQAISSISSSLTELQGTVKEQGNTLNEIMNGGGGGDLKGSPIVNSGMIQVYLTLKTANFSTANYYDAALCMTIINNYSADDGINFHLLGFSMCEPGITITTETGGDITFPMLFARDSTLKTNEKDTVYCGLNSILYCGGRKINLSPITCRKNFLHVPDNSYRDTLRKFVVDLYNQEHGTKKKYYSSISDCTVKKLNAGKCNINLKLQKQDVPKSLDWFTFRDVPVHFEHYGDISSYSNIGGYIGGDNPQNFKFNTIIQPKEKK